MSLPYLPLLQGDDHTDIAMLYRYLNAVIAAFIPSVNEAVNDATINGAIDPTTFADDSIPFVKLQELPDNGIPFTKLQQLSSGIYTPTITVTSNISAVTAYVSQWMRVGNTVIVSGQFAADTITVNLATAVTLTLPVASDLQINEQLGGVAFDASVAGFGASIYADTGGNRAIIQWVATDTTNQVLSFIFMYLIV